MAAPPALRRPIWAALVALQLGACGLQLARGFVPLRRPPGRVALSWDMFAPAVSRCVVRFVPPLPWPSHAPLASLHQLAMPLEWDLVYDHIADYEQASRSICAGAPTPTHARLLCFTAAGERCERELACR